MIIISIHVDPYVHDVAKYDHFHKKALFGNFDKFMSFVGPNWNLVSEFINDVDKTRESFSSK